MPAPFHGALAAALLIALPVPAFAQGLDLTVNHVGLAIGDVPGVTGLRINYRDRNLEWVNGVNITIWSPYGEGSGMVRGLAPGLPLTGAGRIDGVATGILGVGAGDRIRGLGVGPLGIGAGGRLEGIMVGGLGVGSGGRVEGIAIGGLGVGAPRVHGIALAFLGVGAQEARGAMIAPWVQIERGQMQGLTVGAFNRVKGLHHGLAIGVVNYAEEPQGVQIGLINIARNNPRGAKVLPIANAYF